MNEWSIAQTLAIARRIIDEASAGQPVAADRLRWAWRVLTDARRA